MADSSKAIFLSYASQDAEAARRICDAMRAAGLEVWFDQSELRGGDTWDHKIRKQIKECALFVPIISANTNSRPEGYFRLEWKLAVDRSHLLADDHAFLFPVVIDDTAEPTARVPEKFRDVQWTRLNVKDTPETLARRVGKLLDREVETGRARPVERGGRSASSKKEKQPSWLRLAWSCIGLIFALTFILRPMWRAGRHADDKPISAVDVSKIVSDARALAANAAGTPPVPEVPAPPSEARQLAAKAEDLFTSLDSSRDDFVLAEEMLKQAVAKAPADAEVWAIYAYLHERYGARGWDPTNERRELARVAVQRALRLDPKSYEARFAAASLYTGASERDNREREQAMRALLQERPDDKRVLRALAAILRYLPNREEETIQLYDRAARLPGGDPLALYNKALALWFAGRAREATAAVAEAVTQQPFVSARLLAAFFALSVDGDLERAKALLDQLPSATFQDDRGCYFAYLVYAYRDEPDQALAVLQSYPRDWISDNWFRGPRGLLAGNALAQAGRPDAAAVEWRAALKLVDQRLVDNPNSLAFLSNRLLLLAKLGETEAARQLRPAVRQMLQATRNSEAPKSSEPQAAWYAEACLAMGERTDALAVIRSGLNSKRHAIFFTASDLRHDPAWKAARNDPEFMQLVAEADRLERADAQRESPSVALAPSTVDGKSVAVLAFTNLSDDKGNEYFSDGISEELLNVLAKIPGLKVSARTSAFFFKGKEVQIPEIARQLGVAYVVEGSVRKSGDKVRITAQLIKASDGFHVWSDTFTRDLKDVFAVQDEIAGLIAQNLSLEMGVAPAASRRAVNPEAHRLVLEGRYFWNLRTVEGFARAETAFTKASELDPQFAQAHAGLADVWVARAIYQGYEGSNSVTALSAISEAERALAIDPSLAEAYPAKGGQLMCEGRLGEAEQVFKQAIGLNPNYALAHHWYALTLERQGRLDVALDEIEQAIRLDPLSVAAISTRARFLMSAGRVAEALADYGQGLAMRPNFLFVQGDRALCLQALGRTDEALAVARLIAANPAPDRRWIADAEVVHLLRQTGHQAEADDAAARQLARFPSDSFLRGFVLAAQGRQAEALPFLERTPVALQAILFWNPIWDPWREDPRFRQLLVKLGCAEAYKVARETMARMRKEQKAGK